MAWKRIKDARLLKPRDLICYTAIPTHQDSRWRYGIVDRINQETDTTGRKVFYIWALWGNSPKQAKTGHKTWMLFYTNNDTNYIYLRYKESKPLIWKRPNVGDNHEL